jgi:ankyrin repeat protein
MTKGSGLQSIHIAADKDHIEVIKLFLEETDVDISEKRQRHGRQALGYACTVAVSLAMKILSDSF